MLTEVEKKDSNIIFKPTPVYKQSPLLASKFLSIVGAKATPPNSVKSLAFRKLSHESEITTSLD